MMVVLPNVACLDLPARAVGGVIGQAPALETLQQDIAIVASYLDVGPISFGDWVPGREERVGKEFTVDDVVPFPVSDWSFRVHEIPEDRGNLMVDTRDSHPVTSSDAKARKRRGLGNNTVVMDSLSDY